MSANVSPPPYPMQYSYASSTLGLAITLPIIDLIVVALRFASRRKQKLRGGLDDWLGVGALVFTWACAICIYTGISKHVLGYPTPEISFSSGTTPKQKIVAISITNQVNWAHNLMSIIALGLIRLSVLFLLRRTIQETKAGPQPFINAAIWNLVIIDLMWLISFLIAHFAQCNSHFDAIWGSPEDYQAYCSSTYAISLGNAISDVILNCLVIVLSVPVAWGLRLNAGMSLGLAVAFLLGFAALGGNITRIMAIVQSQTVSGSYDHDLYTTNLVWWTFFEVGMAMMASSLSTLGPLFRDLKDHGFVNDLRVGMESLIYIAPPNVYGDPVLASRQNSFKPDMMERSESRLPVTERTNSVVSEMKAARRGDEVEHAVEHHALDMMLIS